MGGVGVGYFMGVKTLQAFDSPFSESGRSEDLGTKVISAEFHKAFNKEYN